MAVVLASGATYAATTMYESNTVGYDNTTSGLRSTNVQDALDELYGNIAEVIINIKNIIGNSTLTTSNQTLSGAINELDGEIEDKIVFKTVHVVPSDSTNKIYDTGVRTTDYFYIGSFTPFDSNIEVRMSNLDGGDGTYRFILWDSVTDTKITNGYDYYVYCAFLLRDGLKEIN